MLNTFKQTKKCIKADLEKINGKFGIVKLIKTILFEPGFKYIFWMRLTQYFWLKCRGVRFPLFVICRFILKHYSYKFNYDISYRADIAPGFSISHHGYIIIHKATKIGKDCWIRPGLCIGKKDINDDSAGAVIGDYCEIGVGVGIFGSPVIGDNVKIGANSIITKDVPSSCVVAGIPAKIIKRFDD